MDTTALDGLRGCAALHILLFHGLWYSSLHINTMASLHMPLFFMLSGYCLTLGYGRKKYSGLTACCGSCKRVDQASSWIKCGPCLKRVDLEQDSSNALPVFDTWKFYWNRFNRLFPVVFICWLYPIILMPFGQGYHAPDNWTFNVLGSIEQLFGVQTMIAVHGAAPNGPSCFLVRAQRWTTKKLQFAVVWLFYAQWIIGTAIWLFFYVFDEIGQLWMFSTAHPVSRFPLFLMGVCGGLLSNREEEENVKIFPAKSKNLALTLLHDIIPWTARIDQTKDSNASSQSTWKRRVNVNLAFYILVLVIFSTLNILYNFAFNYWGVPNTVLHDQRYPLVPIEVEIFKDLVWAWPACHLQFLLPYLELVIIVGLCRDGGLSWFSRIFKTKVCQFLGNISMPLYLVHEPLIFCISLVVNGPIYEWPDKDATAEEKIAFNLKKQMPVWGIPVHFVIALLFGTLLTYLVETPAKNFLRKMGDKWWFGKKDEVIAENHEMKNKMIDT